MAPDGEPYLLLVTRTARRQLSEGLPEGVASAAYQFIQQVLLSNPQRMGKALRPPLDGQHSARRGDYRITYRIDEERRTVTVLTVTHRRDTYRG